MKSIWYGAEGYEISGFDSLEIETVIWALARVRKSKVSRALASEISNAYNTALVNEGYLKLAGWPTVKAKKSRVNNISKER